MILDMDLDKGWMIEKKKKNLKRFINKEDCELGYDEEGIRDK